MVFVCKGVCTIYVQFGFKAHHSTDLCIYALKEVVELYKRQNSTVIIGLLMLLKLSIELIIKSCSVN